MSEFTDIILRLLWRFYPIAWLTTAIVRFLSAISPILPTTTIFQNRASTTIPTIFYRCSTIPIPTIPTTILRFSSATTIFVCPLALDDSDDDDFSSRSTTIFASGGTRRFCCLPVDDDFWIPLAKDDDDDFSVSTLRRRFSPLARLPCQAHPRTAQFGFKHRIQPTSTGKAIACASERSCLKQRRPLPIRYSPLPPRTLSSD